MVFLFLHNRPQIHGVRNRTAATFPAAGSPRNQKNGGPPRPAGAAGDFARCGFSRRDAPAIGETAGFAAAGTPGVFPRGGFPRKSENGGPTAVGSAGDFLHRGVAEGPHKTLEPTLNAGETETPTEQKRNRRWLRNAGRGQK